MEWIISKQYIEYTSALEYMKQRVSDIVNNKKEELIWFLEHLPVYTAGSSADKNEILNAHKFPVIDVGRGGKYTYHGPGQRTVYLILDLKKRNLCDLRRYIYLLEEIIIVTLSKLEIKSHRKPSYIGVWTKHNSIEKKIAAIGVRVTKWIAYHGIAININPDLSHYNNIIPCGIKNFPVTSIADLGIKATMGNLDAILKLSMQNIIL